jgi:glycosyltransferase involved in cell wall biosynthesis
MFSLVQVLRKIRPRTVLSSGHMSLILALVRPLLPRGTKPLIREYSVRSIGLKSDTRRPHIWRRLYQCLYRQVDGVVCQSDSIVKDLCGQFRLSQQKLIGIYNPIDIDLVRELGKRGGNPYSGAGPYLAAAERLSNEKGFDLLLAAMPKIIKCFPNLQLTILGEGPLRIALTEQVQNLGLRESVNFCGFQRNPWPYLRHADLFVLSSRYECFGNVLLEALAFDTPAVAADCPGAVREIYGGNPAVRLVPARDSSALAEAIVERCRASGHIPTDSIPSPDWFAKFTLQRSISEYSSLFLS